MVDHVDASQQGPEGPQFAAKQIANIWHPVGIGPILLATTPLDGVLSGGLFLLPAAPGVKYRFVYNKSTTDPLVLEFGTGGMKMTLNPAPDTGLRGDQWDMSEFYWDGDILLHGTGSEPFGAGAGF